MGVERKEKLSEELVVACVILEHQDRGEKIWFRKLVKKLEGQIPPERVARALRTLTDFSVLRAQFGETEPGKGGRLLYICSEAEDRIREIYNKYYRNDGK